MKKEYTYATPEQIERFKERGYTNENILPKLEEERTTNARNFFTLWMGSIHNIPNYAAVGSYLLLGLSPLQVMIAIMISGLMVALFMSYNGRAGATYGIPFSMHLRSVYGNVGAKLPGFLRGVIAAIAWFSLQTYIGSVALLILISKIWPGFIEIGNGFEILGITIPGLISFFLFWLANIGIGFGGGKTLNRFTGILTPIIYIVFGGMSIWAIRVGGGLGTILNYSLGTESGHSTFYAILIVISSILSVWAAPGVSVSDFTQNAKSNEEQTKGQISGLFIGYLVFSFMSVVILVGGSLHFNVLENDVLSIVEKWDSLPAIIISTLVFLSTTISTNATGNIIPAAYQLIALFPKHIDYRKGVLIAGFTSIFILPWKFMGEGGAIITFLNLIGALLGPVGGVMISHYYVVKKSYINLDELYMDERKKIGQKSKYYGVNQHAYIATLGALFILLGGQFIPSLSIVSDISWIAGFLIAAGIYLFLVKFFPRENITGITLENKQK